MIATNGSETVLAELPVNADSQGRLRVSKEQRGVILEKFFRSGLSAPRFAQQAGLKYSTFAGWLARHRRATSVERKSPVRLLEAVVASPACVLQVHLPGGARLEIREAGQVALAAALVQALEKPC